jgi:hypothetical protein
VRDGDNLLPDDGEGQEFATLDAVRGEATENARQLLSIAVLNGTASLNQQIEVMDEHGKTVLTVPVGRAVGTEAQRLNRSPTLRSPETRAAVRKATEIKNGSSRKCCSCCSRRKPQSR